MYQPPTGLYVLVYYDEDLDGLNWCVEFSDSESTTRFGTMAGALAYVQQFEDALRQTPKL